MDLPFRIYSSRRERLPKATTVTLSNSLLTFFLSFNYLQPSSVGEKKLIHARGKSLHFPPAKLKQKEGCVLSGGESICAVLVCAEQENVCACSYTQPLADHSEPRNLNTRVSEHLLLSASTCHNPQGPSSQRCFGSPTVIWCRLQQTLHTWSCQQPVPYKSSWGKNPCLGSLLAQRFRSSSLNKWQAETARAPFKAKVKTKSKK